MNTVNTTENTERPENTEHPEPAASQDTSIYVRRGRTPTLGFWVALALILPAVGALIAVPFFAFGDLRAIANFVLLAMVVVGLPLAALAALIDSLRHRKERRPRA